MGAELPVHEIKNTIARSTPGAAASGGRSGAAATKLKSGPASTGFFIACLPRSRRTSTGGISRRDSGPRRPRTFGERQQIVWMSPIRFRRQIFMPFRRFRNEHPNAPARADCPKTPSTVFKADNGINF
jgi:hypothetical protein